MSDTRHCQFFLLRYAPCAVNDEFINIGVVLLEEQTGFCRVGLTDWKRVQRVVPDADIQVLRGIAGHLTRSLESPESREETLRTMDDSYSNAIQLSARKECLTTDPRREFETLVAQYL
jgi:hypothetical protein